MSSLPPHPPVPTWVDHAVFYQVYPQAFYDSNGDGIGDLPGLIAKLDYLAGLGINAIWVSPFYKSPMRDAGYDIADFYMVDPRYGTNEDARRLFSEAKRQGIRVLLDFVAGHTSIDHAWFQNSCQDEASPQKNWYVWTDRTWENGGPEFRASMIHGYCNRDGNFLFNFFWHQPALNYGFAHPDQAWQVSTTHPDVRALWDEMKNILCFWLREGASGFRVDMAGSITKNDPDKSENRRFWHEAREAMEKINPEVFTVAEWSNPKQCLDGLGLHADFLHWDSTYENLFRKEARRAPGDRRNGHSYFDREGKGGLDEFLQVYLDHYLATRDKGYISIPVANHDLCRINIDRADPELEIIYAFLFTMPGVPFFYYGDEIGMRQLSGLPCKEGCYPPRSGARTPMQWSSGPNAGFSSGSADQIWYPVDPEPDAPNVAEQEERPDSLLQRVKALIGLRRTEPALAAYADFQVLHSGKNTYPFVYRRGNDTHQLVIVINPADRSFKIEVDLPNEARASRPLAGFGAQIHLDGSHRAVLSGVGISYGIFQL
jgi:glycosidase